jgi:hypothetical protein
MQQNNNERGERMTSETLEKFIIKGLYSDIEDYNSKVFRQFKKEYFDDPIAADIFTITQRHYSEYNVMPTLHELQGKISGNHVWDDVKTYLQDALRLRISSTDALFKETTLYLKEKALKTAIVQSVDDVDTNPQRFFDRIDAVRELTLEQSSQFDMSFPWNGESYRQRTDIDDRQYYLYPIIPHGGHIIMLAGQKGTGKSWISLKWADSITKCEDWDIWKAVDHERCIGQPAKVLYLDGEMSKEDLKPRLDLLQANENLIPYQYMDIANEDKRDKLQNKEYRDFVLKRIVEEQFDVVILDNIISLFVGLEIMGTQDWSPINEWLLELRMNNICVILVDHMGKDSSRGAIGSSSKIFNVDDVIYLTNPSEHNRVEGLSCELNFEYSRSGGSLPHDENRKLLGRKTISLTDGDWEIEGYADTSSPFSKTEDINFKAMTVLKRDPDMWKSNLLDEIGKGKNYPIIKNLIHKNFIRISENEGTRYEKKRDY